MEILSGLNLDEVELSKGFEKYYNYRVESFLRYLESENELKISDSIETKTKKIGELIQKSYITGMNLSEILNNYGYQIFSYMNIKEFEEYLENDNDILNNIISGNLLVGYDDDFQNLLLISKSYNAGEKVSKILLN